MTFYDSRGTHHVIKCLPPPKILPRVIITYGACARGGGRRPGFEASPLRMLASDNYAWVYLRSVMRAATVIKRHRVVL